MKIMILCDVFFDILHISNNAENGVIILSIIYKKYEQIVNFLEKKQFFWKNCYILVAIMVTEWYNQ